MTARRGHRRRGSAAAPADGQLSAGRGTYLLLGVVVLISLFPLYWSLVAASPGQRRRSAQSPPTLMPGANLLENLRPGLRPQTDMRLALINSVIVVGDGDRLGACSPRRWPGSPSPSCGSGAGTRCWSLVVATMMVPTQLGIIPLYIMMADWLRLVQPPPGA